MLEYLGMTGTVSSITETNDVTVVYPDRREWKFNPAVLTKFTGNQSSNLNANFNNVNSLLTSTNEAVSSLNSSFDPFDHSRANRFEDCLALQNINSIPNNLQHLNSNYGEFSNQFLGNNSSNEHFQVGDLVRISSNLERIKRLQQHHGEWSEVFSMTIIQFSILILISLQFFKNTGNDHNLR